ncbi:glycosyltransferase family A protein [Tistrella mobilis]
MQGGADADGGATSVPLRRPDAGYIIAIPARDEAARITGCLDACARAVVRARPLAGRILVLVNNSVDDTAARATAWAVRADVPAEVVSCRLPRDLAHAGAARRQVLDLARARLGKDGALLTTDADSRPDPGWVVANLAALRRGAALVCGQIAFDPAEFDRLPPQITGSYRLQARWRHHAAELAARLDPDPHDPWPCHGLVAGASLAVTARAWDLTGGLPIVPRAEDRALARRIRAHGLPVRHDPAVRVVTSCRLAGRASGGLADTLAAGLVAGDHQADEDFEPLGVLWLRAVLRAQVRRLLDDDIDPAPLLRWSGFDGHLPDRAAGFGPVWTAVDAQHPHLARQRMRLSDVAAGLPRLMAACRALRSGHGCAEDADHLLHGTS